MTKRELASALAKGKFDKVVFFLSLENRKGWDWEPTTSSTSYSHMEGYLGCISWANCYNMTASEILDKINQIVNS